MKKIVFQRMILPAALIAALGYFSGCTNLDVDTDDGLRNALVKREKLDKAIPKITGMASRPEKIGPYIDILNDMYLKGSGFDRDVITALAQAGDPRSDKAFEKAAKSQDRKQVMQAAFGIKKTKNADIQKQLLDRWDEIRAPEAQRVILDTGTVIKSDAIAGKAKEILSGNYEDTPYALLRTSCQVLAHQQDPSAAETLVVALFYMDQVGHSLTTDCTKALLSLGKETALPVLLKAYQLENADLNKFIAEHPDTMTLDTVRNNMANDLAILRAKEAVKPMLDFIGNTKQIAIPGTLVLKASGDPAWVQWASLVGASSQSSFFAVNDIGVAGHEADAKRIFTEIFNWTEPYQAKFKNAIKLTGTTNIEVSQRVNAFRVLRENGLITSEETLSLIQMLKGEEFKDESMFRHYARSSIATDMITYIAVTAKGGEIKTLWQAFSDMKAQDGVFYLPEEEASNPKSNHANVNIFKRIEDVLPAFELADTCDTSAPCYAKAVVKQDGTVNEKASNYERIRAVYEFGATGDHEYFETVCNLYQSFDMFGQIYATNALAKLGTKEDVPRIEELIKTLSKSMSQIAYQSAKPNLENLIVTLNNK